MQIGAVGLDRVDVRAATVDHPLSRQLGRAGRMRLHRRRRRGRGISVKMGHAAGFGQCRGSADDLIQFGQVVAAGRAGLVTGDMIKPGAVVVDVGINVTDDGLVGDVDFESVSQVASAITPVPGGVGPLSSAILLTHLMRAARDQATRHVAVGAPSVRAD